MDQAGLKLEPTVEAVLAHIAANRNFLLSGGAGSGKTYTLVQVIGEILRKEPSAFVACITYTNAAVHEIESRLSNERLFVSTIHDFLWSAIAPYQAELKASLIKLLSGEDPEIKAGITPVSTDMFTGKKITYKDYLRIDEGIISHDELIKLAAVMFELFPKLRHITRCRFKYILVDEYQDTAPQVVKILLEYLPQSARKGVCGFFGDAMQSIYDDGVGDVQNYIATGALVEVKKEQNRRNPRLVFELANRLRTDGIVQHASDDLAALQINVREGEGVEAPVLAGWDEGGVVLGVVLFDSGRASIRPGYDELLDRVAAELERGGGGRVAIVGHTDAHGSHEFNTRLGMQRARAVFDALVARLSPAVRERVRVEASADPRQPVDASKTPGGPP